MARTAPAALFFVACLTAAAPGAAQGPPPPPPPTQQNPPVPLPFPRSGQPPAAPRPADPASPAAPQVAPTVASEIGVPLYPNAEFLEVHDLGAGQRVYLFGVPSAYAETVGWYRSVLKTNGRELFRAPAMHQFDLGRFDDRTMVYPPSIVIKDYASTEPGSYLHVNGTSERRFATIVQVVPAR